MRDHAPGAERPLGDDERATRVGRLLLDTESRHIVHLAVSNGMVYYATTTRRVVDGEVIPSAPFDVTIERVVLRNGRFERLPSFDVDRALGSAPIAWEHFAASGERALWSADGQLFVLDFAGAEPRLETHDLGLRGCAALDLRGGTAYCAQGPAGYLAITLGQPRPCGVHLT